MKTWLPLLVAVALVVPATSWAADGDACDSDTGLITTGAWRHVACINVCDGKAAADSSCTEFDLDSSGMPDIIVFEREDVGADCTDPGGPTITITTGPVTGGSPSYDLDTSTVVLNDTTERVVISTKDAIVDRYLFFATSDDTACTDVDVRMYLFNRGEL